ncbi:MAG: hypothetical protein HY064_03070 [Bacteroidetes bacterium]|nr:hypothetical protein [Bacteroidota bacterium]
MKKYIFSTVIFFLLFAIPTNAQYALSYGSSFGASAYRGEMGMNHKDFQLFKKRNEINISYGIYARYKLKPAIFLKADLLFSRISGSDQYSTDPSRRFRNLDFRNDLVELNCQGELRLWRQYIFNSSYRYITFYELFVATGPGIVFSNPKAFYAGEWIPLQPLKTEGQHYSKTQFEIPFSIGSAISYRKKYKAGIDFTWHSTFTDYLDDVSKNYVDPNSLSSQLSANLANRSSQFPFPVSTSVLNNYAPGTVRGDRSRYDSYFTCNVDLAYVIRGQTRYYHVRPNPQWTPPRPKSKVIF